MRTLTDIRHSITDMLTLCGADELAVLELVIHRVVKLGAKQYGNLDLTTDGRDFVVQALEEAADGMFYVGSLLEQARRVRAQRSAAYDAQQLDLGLKDALVKAGG